MRTLPQPGSRDYNYIFGSTRNPKAAFDAAEEVADALTALQKFMTENLPPDVRRQGEQLLSQLLDSLSDVQERGEEDDGAKSSNSEPPPNSERPSRMATDALIGTGNGLERRFAGGSGNTGRAERRFALRFGASRVRQL